MSDFNNTLSALLLSFLTIDNAGLRCRMDVGVMWYGMLWRLQCPPIIYGCAGRDASLAC